MKPFANDSSAVTTERDIFPQEKNTRQKTYLTFMFFWQLDDLKLAVTLSISFFFFRQDLHIFSKVLDFYQKTVKVLCNTILVEALFLQDFL